MNDILEYLFKTNAIKFCEENKPFFLTSGYISPYFSNTHFLYGSENEATEFLNYIDVCLADKSTLPKKIFDKVLNQYETNEIYKNSINAMVNFIKQNVDLSSIDYISGGERRDWYFTNIIAYLLGKPHITIFKDLSTLISDSNFEETKKLTSLEGKKVLHIVDLVTVASSYIRFWIPAIKSLGAEICYSFAFVDRNQGGKEIIEEAGIKSFALVTVDKAMFEKALDLNVINKTQFDMLVGFLDDSYNTMRNFLLAHPEFLENALNSDEKTKSRAKSLIDQDLYNLK